MTKRYCASRRLVVPLGVIIKRIPSVVFMTQQACIFLSNDKMAAFVELMPSSCLGRDAIHKGRI